MPFPLFLILILIFICWFSCKRHSASVKEEETRNLFWDKEAAANSCRNQNISQLPYITVPLDSLPFSLADDETLLEWEAAIKVLADKKILNLTGISNTQLKLDYGTGNLPVLTQCDQNFTSLVQSLLGWGQQLSSLGFTNAAITVLEFGITCRSDITANYSLLAKLYQETGQLFKIQNLLDTAYQLNSLSKEGIITHLKEYVQTGK